MWTPSAAQAGGAGRPFPGVPPDRDDLPAAAHAVALASVGGIGAVRLRQLLEEASPPEAWASMVATGAWRDQARQVDVAAVWEDHRGKGIDVLVLGDERYPAALASDPEAPAVLFALGDPAVIDRHPRVAVVGTRRATRYGLGMAAQLGADLTAAGVAVVSGLAPGIDTAAHEGATAARLAALDTGGPPVGVVAGSARDALPRRARPDSGSGWPNAASCCRSRRRAPPSPLALPPAPPDPGRAGRRGGGGRVPRPRRPSTRGAVRRPARRLGGGGARIGPQSGIGRDQRPVGRRLFRGARRGGRAGGGGVGPGGQ